MPINILKDGVIRHLNAIGFRKTNKKFSCSPQDCLKNVLLRESNVNVKVINQSEFRVSFQADSYYASVVSDYYFSLQKVKRQRESLNKLLEGSGSGAWMLVTAYYQAFYAAIQIARLTGKYSLYLDRSMTDYINEFSEHPKLKNEGVYLGVSILLEEKNDFVVVRFSNHGMKPHNLVWRNISDCIGSGQRPTISEPKRASRISLFQEIVGSDGNSAWPTPNGLRNDWNYSRIDAYESSSDQKLKQLKHILQENDFNRAKAWCDQNKRKRAESDPSAALGYVCQVLDSVMKNVSNRLL